MKCFKCSFRFEEKELQLSHDIPKYIRGTDIDRRHNLCKECHKEYDKLILTICLKYVGEELIVGEEILWMKELSHQSEELKIKFRELAQVIREEFFNE